MDCKACHTECKRFGTDRKGNQRFRCRQCNKTYSQITKKPISGMTIPREKMLLAMRLLVEGNSIRSIERTTDLHRDTILKLLVIVGEKCERIMGRLIVNIPCKDVECDEIWAFVGKKEAHKGPKEAHNDTIGDQYCFVGIERNTKLVLNFALGRRDTSTTQVFIEGLRAATSDQSFQISTDGFQPYVPAICDTLGDRVDFAQIIKVYTQSPEGERKYSPAEVASMRVVPVMGNPDPARICTSIVERQNLTIRMQMRRLTRLTNAFSKKWENLWAAYCLHFAYYNFCRIHRSLRVTPAMQAGIVPGPWKLSDLLAA